MKPLKVCKHMSGILYFFIPKEAVLKLGLRQGQKVVPVLRKNGIFYRVVSEEDERRKDQDE